MAARVVLWLELFWPNIGGAEIFSARLMCALRARGFELSVVTTRDPAELPERDLYRGIPVYRFPFRDVLAPSRLAEALRLRREVTAFVAALNPDLIHLIGVAPSAFFCLDVVRRTGVPLLARLNHEPVHRDIERYRGSLLAQVLAAARWTVTVSHSLLRLARDLEPAIRPTSGVIYNGVEAPEACPAPSEEPLLLCIGRLVEDKGFDVAIEAFARIAAAWPRSRMLMVGDGPARARLETLAAARGVAERVEFRGSVPPDDTARVFAAARFVVIPSRYEGLPAVALQAGAAGRAVVATRAGGLPEIVNDGETGLLVDGDSEAFAAAMTRLLREPESARRMGRAAWRVVRDRFSQRDCVDAYAALYARLLAGE